MLHATSIGKIGERRKKRKSLANKIMETRIYGALSKKVKISLFLFSPYVDRLEK